MPQDCHGNAPHNNTKTQSTGKPSRFGPRRPYFAEMLMLVGLPVLAFILVYVGWDSARQPARRDSCQTMLKQILLASSQYIRDYDEQLPPANRWAESLQRYSRNFEFRDCTVPGASYVYNSWLSELKVTKIIDPSRIALIYDAPGPRGSDGGERWASAGVHLGGNNVAYVDGHVKWQTMRPIFVDSFMVGGPQLKALRNEWWQHKCGPEFSKLKATDPACKTLLLKVQRLEADGERKLKNMGIATERGNG